MAVFGLRATVQTQALMALLVVVLAGAAHISKNPFQVRILHRLELYGLITAFVTLYFGMFFFTKDVEESPFAEAWQVVCLTGLRRGKIKGQLYEIGDVARSQPPLWGTRIH